MSNTKFIKIPRNPKDLHSLKDLKDAYINVQEFNKNLDEYFNTIVNAHKKTLPEVLSEIPEDKWNEYHILPHAYSNITIDSIISNTPSLYDVYHSDINLNSEIYFFIDHITKEIKQYILVYSSKGYNITMTYDPIFKFTSDFKYIEMKSHIVWRSGTYRKPGDAEKTHTILYYFNVNTNTFISNY